MQKGKGAGFKWEQGKEQKETCVLGYVILCEEISRHEGDALPGVKPYASSEGLTYLRDAFEVIVYM